jgi:hypothetical protein
LGKSGKCPAPLPLNFLDKTRGDVKIKGISYIKVKWLKNDCKEIINEKVKPYF